MIAGSPNKDNGHYVPLWLSVKSKLMFALLCIGLNEYHSAACELAKLTCFFRFIRNFFSNFTGSILQLGYFFGLMTLFFKVNWLRRLFAGAGLYPLVDIKTDS